MLARLFARLAQLGFLVVAARHLTISEFGAYSYIVVLTLTISMVVDTGAGLTWGRLVTRDPSQVASVYWQGFSIVVIGAVAASAAVLTASWLDSGPGTVGVVVWAAAASVLLNTLFNYSATMLRSLTRTSEEAAVQAFSALFFVLAGLAVLEAGGTVLALIWVLAAKEGLSWIACSCLLARDTGKPIWHGLGAAKLLGVGIRLSFISTALAIITRAPTVVLGNAASSREVAWFAAPMRFADAALMGATTVGLALLPFMTRLHTADHVEARRTARRLVVMAFCGFGALAMATVPAAHLLVTTVFGARYGPGVGAARILMLALPAYGVLGVLWYWMIASDDDAALARILGLAVVVSVVMCAIAVPAHGSIGAAWAYVVPLVAAATAASVRFLGSAARASNRRSGRRLTIRRRVPASVAGARHE